MSDYDRIKAAQNAANQLLLDQANDAAAKEEKARKAVAIQKMKDIEHAKVADEFAALQADVSKGHIFGWKCQRCFNVRGHRREVEQCVSCGLRKGARTEALDEDGQWHKYVLNDAAKRNLRKLPTISKTGPESGNVAMFKRMCKHHFPEWNYNQEEAMAHVAAEAAAKAAKAAKGAAAAVVAPLAAAQEDLAKAVALESQLKQRERDKAAAVLGDPRAIAALLASGAGGAGGAGAGKKTFSSAQRHWSRRKDHRKKHFMEARQEGSPGEHEWKPLSTFDYNAQVSAYRTDAEVELTPVYHAAVAGDLLALRALLREGESMKGYCYQVSDSRRLRVYTTGGCMAGSSTSTAAK